MLLLSSSQSFNLNKNTPLGAKISLRYRRKYISRFVNICDKTVFYTDPMIRDLSISLKVRSEFPWVLRVLVRHIAKLHPTFFSRYVLNFTILFGFTV